ncbi:hypothetical protein ROHU_004738 [Labeo rohita]|uniref:Uncharacterized protein n=1 Tax=Labeo rohita TaxID=84645 RepID=A0A498NIX1_LABRO|nr:hypothetical protein ROHU_004738 [Labeo rohita]
MDIINITCGEIQSSVGFLYVILPVLLNHTNNPDCEQSWYLQDGRLIADPSEPQTLSDPATAVKSDRLVTSHCVNLKYEIICDSTETPVSHVTAYRVRNETAVTPNSEIQTPVGFLYVILPVLLNHTNNPDCEQSWYLQSHFSHVTAYRVRNQTAATPNSDDLNEAYSDQLWWLLAVFIIIFLAFLCFLLRERIFRTLMKVRSDDPQAVQESEQLNAPEPEV